jgi:hypothetical protein
VVLGWSWSDASAAGGTAGLAVDAVGSGEANAGTRGEPLAAETRANRGWTFKAVYGGRPATPDSSKWEMLLANPVALMLGRQASLDPLARFFALRYPLLSNGRLEWDVQRSRGF